MKAIVFDIGGTAVKYGIFSDRGGVLSSSITSPGTFPTCGMDGAARLFGKIKEVYSSLAASMDEDAPIGICTRGQVNPVEGTVIYDPPEVISGYTGFNIREALSGLTDRAGKPVPLFMENDVNCAALSECAAIASSTVSGSPGSVPPKSLFCLTFGTGIGGALVLDGKVYHGAHFSAGEAGMAYTGGSYYEDLASALSLQNILEALEYPSTERPPRSLKEESFSEPLVKSALDSWSGIAAECAASVIHLLDPAYLVLGGGIMENPIISGKVIEKTRKLLAPGFDTVIKPAEFGNTAGLIGIGLLSAGR